MNQAPGTARTAPGAFCMRNKKQMNRHRNRDATTASRFRRFVEGSAARRNAGAKARPSRRRRRRIRRGSDWVQAQPADHRAAGDVGSDAAAAGRRAQPAKKSRRDHRVSISSVCRKCGSAQKRRSQGATIAPQATSSIARQQPGAGSACRPPRRRRRRIRRVSDCLQAQLAKNSISSWRGPTQKAMRAGRSAMTRLLGSTVMG